MKRNHVQRAKRAVLAELRDIIIRGHVGGSVAVAEHREADRAAWLQARSLLNAALKFVSSACPKCGQVSQGQTGEYPCERCGLPVVWDAEVSP